MAFTGKFVNIYIYIYIYIYRHAHTHTHTWIQENLVPKGVEITLEPTIGNFDQEFVDNWCTILKQFSIVLMKQILAYCDKTTEKTKSNETKTILKQQLK